MRRALFFAPLALLACNNGGDDGEDTDTDVDDGVLTFEDFVNVTDEATGDFTCHTAGEAWLTQNVDATLQQVQPATLSVLDFQEDDPVPEATVKVWYADDVTTTADVEGETDQNGVVTLDVKTCTPSSYVTYTDPALEATKETFEAHQIFPYASGGTVEAELNSVSDTTYKIIPSLLGISPDADKGIIAGTAFDCNEDPIENAQVVVKDAAGNIPQSLIIKYFVDDFPNRDQPDTSADGLWVAINVPPGEWTVEMWTVRGGALVLSGSTVVQSYENSINISNIYSGYDKGVKYPAECLVAE